MAAPAAKVVQHVKRGKGVGLVRASQPRVTTTGSAYYTDGLRAVFMFEDREISLSEIGFFEWERLIDHHRKQP